MADRLEERERKGGQEGEVKRERRKEGERMGREIGKWRGRRAERSGRERGQGEREAIEAMVRKRGGGREEERKESICCWMGLDWGEGEGEGERCLARVERTMERNSGEKWEIDFFVSFFSFSLKRLEEEAIEEVIEEDKNKHNSFSNLPKNPSHSLYSQLSKNSSITPSPTATNCPIISIIFPPPPTTPPPPPPTTTTSGPFALFGFLVFIPSLKRWGKVVGWEEDRERRVRVKREGSVLRMVRGPSEYVCPVWRGRRGRERFEIRVLYYNICIPNENQNQNHNHNQNQKKKKKKKKRKKNLMKPNRSRHTHNRTLITSFR